MAKDDPDLHMFSHLKKEEEKKKHPIFSSGNEIRKGGFDI